jgi:hypothetical protein
MLVAIAPDGAAVAGLFAASTMTPQEPQIQAVHKSVDQCEYR